jgi:hypothetical protein
VTLTYSDFHNYFHKDNPAEYAELILAVFNRMNSQWGFVPDAVEVILEPDNNSNSNWTAAKIAACLSATQSRLAAADYHPRFIVPSVERCLDADTWYNNIKTADNSVIQYVDELSYHRYSNCSLAELAQNRDAAAADGNNLAMLEWWDSANSYLTLHDDLGPSGNGVAWEGGVIAYPNQPDKGGVYFLVDSSTNSITIASRAKFYRQYFKWIRRGALRKATSTTNANFDALAFRNTGGNYTVVVNCLTSGSFTIGGLPAGTYHITYTTASAYNQSAADQAITSGQYISTSIPAAGALTVYADAPAPIPTPSPTPTPTPLPTPTPTPMPPQLQLVLDPSGIDPNQAAALDSVLFLRDPFPVIDLADLLNLTLNRNTRVIIWVANLQLAQGEAPSSVVVNLLDGNNQSYDMAAEDVRPVPGFDLTQVTFELPDTLFAGTCTIEVRAHGQFSNHGTVRIGP